jgi:SAM-dependent MidA family methyltransferase
MPRSEASSVSAGLASAPARAPSTPVSSSNPELAARIAEFIALSGGWLSFDRFMALALYEPGLGYYARHDRPEGPFGRGPSGGSDFVTAPHLSPLFARALARQVAEGLAATDSAVITEFGAGTGRLARQLLQALQTDGVRVECYQIVDLSGALRQRQRESLEGVGVEVRWLDAWPERIGGVVLGNELLDAMPVRLLHRTPTGWQERGVALASPSAGRGVAFDWADRPTDLRPPVDRPLDGPWLPGTVIELPEQAPAFVRSLGERLDAGLVLLVDYGFPQDEFYLSQRLRGTLMCHRAHRADDEPLHDVGAKDITAHVDFTAMALAAQEVGLDVLGYTSQANFLLNCGFADDVAQAPPIERPDALRLVHEHEMGELFKVIALGRLGHYPAPDGPLGFRRGDRTHRL